MTVARRGTVKSDFMHTFAVAIVTLLVGGPPAVAEELVINLKTAKALDITIPPALLARADNVIE